MLTATRSGTWHSSALVSSETEEDRPSGWCQLLVIFCMSSLNQGRLKGAAVMTERVEGARDVESVVGSAMTRVDALREDDTAVNLRRTWFRMIFMLDSIILPVNLFFLETRRRMND